MAQIKGSMLTSRLAFVEEQGEPGDKERVLAQMPARLAAELEANVLPSDWYPFELFVELSRAIDQVLGKGDLALAREMGGFAAEQLLRTIYKSFSKEGHPGFLFQRASAVWSQFYDTGRLTVVEEGPKQIRLLVTDFANPAREHCLSVEGWIEKNVEFSGATGVRVEEVKCRARGDSACEYVTRWD